LQLIAESEGEIFLNERKKYLTMVLTFVRVVEVGNHNSLKFLKESKMKTKMSVDEVSEMLMGVDELVKSRGNFVARRTFFYQTLSLESWIASLREQLKTDGFEMKVINSGVVEKPFVGGAPVRKSSHLWVEFII
jgi:hypothetical protein